MVAHEVNHVLMDQRRVVMRNIVNQGVLMGIECVGRNYGVSIISLLLG